MLYVLRHDTRILGRLATRNIGHGRDHHSRHHTFQNSTGCCLFYTEDTIALWKPMAEVRGDPLIIRALSGFGQIGAVGSRLLPSTFSRQRDAGSMSLDLSNNLSL